MRKVLRHAPLALLAAAALLAFACGRPFGEESSGPRFTPSIGSLRVSPASFFCDEKFTATFTFEDPQMDIATVHLVLTGETNGGLIAADIDWNDLTQITHPSETVSGTAKLTYTIRCDDENPTGSYILSISVEDVQEHVSNVIERRVDLL